MKIRKVFWSVIILFSMLAYKKVKAVDNNDTPQQIKDLITRMKGQIEKDDDSFPIVINEAAQMAATSDNPASTAVLRSMIAEMYVNYYNRNRWKIQQRTPIVGYIPADMQVWTNNIFIDTIQWYVNKSLIDASLLQKTPVSAYNLIMNAGKNSPDLRPTLFDFLSYRGISLLEAIDNGVDNISLRNNIKDIYLNLIAFRKNENNPKALLLVELDYLQYLYGGNNSPEDKNRYQAALDSLQHQYASQPFSVEIAIAQVALYRQASYWVNNPDSVNGLIYNLCKETIAKYPKYNRTEILKNRLNQLTQPSLNLYTDQTAYPDKDMKLHLRYKNIPSITITLYRSNLSPEFYYSGDNKKPSVSGQKVKQVTVKLDVPAPYSQCDTTISLPMSNQLGLYQYVITSGGKVPQIEQIVSVSRLFAINRTVKQNIEDILVTDYISGEPIENAQVIIYSGKPGSFKKVKTITTNSEGLVQLSLTDSITAYRVVKGEDSYTTLSALSSRNWWPRNSTNNREEVTLFTDRGIYRPGQTLFFKGIAYLGNPDDPHVLSNKSYTVKLFDANNQEIANKTFTTNEFGSFDGKFVLPQQTLNGYFTLRTTNAVTSIRVEEYKRPSFIVSFMPIKQEIMFGDNITLHGTARTYSGVDLEGAAVEYRIIRRPIWRLIGNYSGREVQVAHGTTTVGSNGTFAVSFKPEKNIEEGKERNLYYRYEVIAVVTTGIGETQEGNYFFSVGDRSMSLSISIPALLNKDGDEKVIINASNLNGQKVAVRGKYALLLLEDSQNDEPEADLPVSERAVKEKVYQGNFTSGVPLDAHLFNRFPSGRYRIVMEAPDSQNRMVTDEQEFILYGTNDRKPPVFSYLWTVQDNVKVLPGQTAEILFGTSVQDAYVLYEIIANGNVLESKRLKLSDENKLFHIPYTENFGNGVVVSFTYVKNGTVYNRHISLLKAFPDRSLTIRPQTFRDRLLPGQKETWSFRITNADSTAVLAEMLTTMYDASLDQLFPFNWYFNPIRTFYPSYYGFSEGNAFESTGSFVAAKLPSTGISYRYEFDRLNWQGLFEAINRYRRGAVMLQSKASGVLAESAVVTEEEESGNQLYDVADAAQIEEVKDRGNVTSNLEETLGIRTNFNETAFFYPNLRTNKDGDVILNFTLPESNTTWKFMALAYTKKLEYGKLEKEVISQKKLMVLPNLPRFVRQGDKVYFSTQIMNLSDKEINGTVTLAFFNPENGQDIVGLKMPGKPFTTAVKGTSQAFWEIAVPDGFDMIGCRIVAQTAEASDGEQHLIPVLPDEIFVTESKPFVIPGARKEIIQTGWKLNKTSRPFRMTLEVTGNPIWYAVQALPSVTLPDNEDVVSWFSAYYSNTLATYIAQSHPKVKKMVELWEKQGGNSETLYSNLQKNQELKNILLEETPWVLAAKNETEQKQQLALLFNINHANDLRMQALNKILKLQNADGGWSWYPGMPANTTITLYILKGMTQLTHLGAVEYGEQEKMMQINALKFLDKHIQNEYENRKEKGAEGAETTSLSSDMVEYLFVRSAYRDIPEYGDAREAIRFYTDVAEKNWDKQSLYGQALIAQLMFRNGKKNIAQDIISSLRKIATQTEEMGMYWANNKRFTDFFISPVSVHCQLMDAFEEISPDKQEINSMKQWLLMQKQTQRWESVPATVNAIYALLSTGTDWLSDNGNCIVTWGKHQFETASGEEGTGYIQETFQGKDITSAMQKVTIQKTGDTPAWGAVYRQYFEKVNKVQAAEGQLNVEKKLFVTVTGNNGPELIPVTASNPLKVGDKVTVRLIITTDREMDYVQLKDMRAGCFEPVDQLSGTKVSDGLWFYQSPLDASQNFFFNQIPKGTYVIEYAVYVSRAGEYAGGISTIQCLYAPEFISHTEGNEINVKE